MPLIHLHRDFARGQASMGGHHKGGICQEGTPMTPGRHGFWLIDWLIDKIPLERRIANNRKTSQNRCKVSRVPLIQTWLSDFRKHTCLRYHGKPLTWVRITWCRKLTKCAIWWKRNSRALRSNVCNVLLVMWTSLLLRKNSKYQYKQEARHQVGLGETRAA